MKRLFFLASLVSLACMSCKSKKEAVKNTETPPVNINSTQESPKIYRLIVSFKSKGAGTETDKRTEFLKFVDNHPLKPAYKTVLWGREGETDYCFDLTELSSKKDLVAFTDQVKKITTGTDLIEVSENAECLHKGR